jgi:ribonuclease VapC
VTKVLDTSAILALIKNEAGSDIVMAALNDAVVSTANVAEVFSYAARNNWPTKVADAFMAHRGLSIAPLSLEEAALAGTMAASTRTAGLSLGDRCCLALAKLRGIPALTADRPWSQFAGSLGVTIELIR